MASPCDAAGKPPGTPVRFRDLSSRFVGGASSVMAAAGCQSPRWRKSRPTSTSPSTMPASCCRYPAPAWSGEHQFPDIGKSIGNEWEFAEEEVLCPEYV